MTDKTTKPDTRGKGAGSNNGGVVHRKDSDFMDYAQAISEEMPIFEQHKNRKDPEDKKIYFGQNPVMLVAIERLLEIITDPKTQRDEKELSLAILCALGGTNRNDTTIRTPYIFIDVDPPKVKKHLPAYIPAETLSKLEGAPYTPMLYKVSYSRTGIHLIYKVTEEVLHKYPHGSIWAAMRAYLKSLDIVIDEKCKDATRLCFLNYDPDAKLDKSARLIGMPFMAKWEQPETPKARPSGSVRPVRPVRPDAAEVERLYRRLLTDAEAFDEGVFEDGSRNSRTNLLAKDCRERGISYAVAIDEAKRLIEGSGYTGAEIEAVFRSVYEHIEVAPLSDYYRIAGIYYKYVDGVLHKWQLREVQRDLGKGWESMITTLDGGFTYEPNNLNFQQVIGNKWNIQPKPPIYEIETDHCDTILALLTHIAKLSTTLDVLLDYIQIALLDPPQKLPVVVVTSKAQSTGKSTWFYLFQLIFGGGSYLGAIEDITSNFTAGWTQCQVICLEESTTDRKAQNDRIKFLATTSQVKYEPKGVDRTLMPFYGKILLANNNEESPVYLQETDQRYMVLRVGTIEAYDADFTRKMEREMGYFLRWLTTERKLSTRCESRLWFAQSIIETEATTAAKAAARPVGEIVVEAMIEAVRADYPDTECLIVRPNSLRGFAEYLGYESNQRSIKAALERRGKRRPMRNANIFEFVGDSWEAYNLIGASYVYAIDL